MKLLYLECAMGAAGDMLTAALLELFEHPQEMVEKLNNLGIPGVHYALEKAEKCGITGSRMAVTVEGEAEESADYHGAASGHVHSHEHSHDHDHEHPHDHDHEHEHEHEHPHDHDHDHEHSHAHGHHHTSMADIRRIVSHLAASEGVKKNILAVYQSIAEAESHAHGMPVEEIHFHEVGSMDAVADVTAVCFLLDALKPDKICASPVHVGSGHVHCAHGILPVPAPATAYLLTGIPVYGGEIQGELCTPTGAALLRHFAAEFGPMPQMAAGKIGYGMGKKDFPMANCLRAMLGETGEQADTVLELQCNLDDMTPEDLGYAQEALLAAGALDVWTSPIGMKKNRPGVLLSVLCRPEERETMTALLFRHTTTLGVRETQHRRAVLTRSTVTRESPLGPVTWKRASGWGVSREKPEFEDVKALAEANCLSLGEVRGMLDPRE